MELTGKAKEEFDLWLLKTYRGTLAILSTYRDPMDNEILSVFYDLPDAFQWGVYVDWFESLGIQVENGTWHRECEDDIKPLWGYRITNANGWPEFCESTRHTDQDLLRIETLEKADEFYHKVLELKEYGKI